MTNKINGIDVSECPLFYDHKIGCYHTFDGECAKDSCAVYKWLLEYKRLQEENEKLRQDWRLDCLKCEYKNTKGDVDKYKQALEEIKKIIKHEDYFGYNFQYDREIAHPIINKIDEVLNDRN